jgi:hypothetical protein
VGAAEHSRPAERCEASTGLRFGRYDGPRLSIAGNTWICSDCLSAGIRGYAAAVYCWEYVDTQPQRLPINGIRSDWASNEMLGRR